MAIHSSLLAWRIPGTGGCRTESDMTEATQQNAYIWNLEKNVSEGTYRTTKEVLQGSNGETDIENQLVDLGRGERRARYMERVTWKLTLLYVK